MKQEETSTRSPLLYPLASDDSSNTNDLYELNECGCVECQIRDSCLCTDCEKEMPNSQSQTLPAGCFFCDLIDLLKDYKSHLDLHHSNSTCSCCNYEELTTHDNLSTMRIVLHLSTLHLNGTSTIKHTVSQIKNLENNINILINSIKTLNDNLRHFSRELNLSQNLAQEVNIQQKNIKKLKSNHDVSEQKIIDLHYTTFDGSLLWIITNVAEKRNEAQLGQQIWFDSPVFYSSPTGYKMRARLYPYGDGDAQGTHMSINLIIFKGKYDAILPWPFNFPVTFCLFDQTGQKYHIVDSFYPDTTSTSFQRPNSEMNIASGIQKFCPLAIIEQGGNFYVRDNKMFIKIMVDFDGIPRQLLPYTSSIDPGLPTYMQEAMRRILIEQYNQVRAALVEEIHRGNQEISQRGFIPTYLPLPAIIRQQVYILTTSSEGISPEDILDAE